MLKSLLLILPLLAVPAQAAVVISEVLFNEVGSDTSGEWIEIYNNGTVVVDLTGWKIGDEETSGAVSDTEGMFSFPSGASIAPGVVQIIAVNANRFSTVYGFLPTYEVGTGANGDNAVVSNLAVYGTWDPDVNATNTINMSNTNDQILLLRLDDAVVDAASWGNTFAFDPGLGSALDGQSYARINPGTDTGTAADWAASFDTGTAATRSTPGVIPEPSAAIMLLSACGIAGLLRRRR